MAFVECHGIALAVGVPGQEGAAPTIVAAVVKRNLAGKWTIVRVGETRDFELIPAGRTLSVPDAFDLVLKLEGDRDVEWAEPMLATPGIEPPPTLRVALGFEVAKPKIVEKALTAGGAAPLPCSSNSEWSLAECRVKQAWAHPLPSHGEGRRRGEGIVIGHPDTGYTLHPEINDPRLRTGEGFDFLDNDPNALDPLTGSFPGHGTGTASVIMSNEGGAATPHVTGVAPLSQLVPLRVSGSVVHFQFSQVTHAIEFARTHGHHVISMSLGGPFPSKELHAAIKRAIESGIVVLAAAGNVWPFVTYPARYDEVIAVAASNCKHQRWPESARGSDVDVSAPGESVWRASQPSGVARGNGTSFAVSNTAAICALWLAYHGRKRLVAQYGARNLAAVFKEIVIRKGVTVPGGWDKNNMGAGIIDALKVLQAPLPATVAAGGIKSLRATAAPRRTDFNDIAHYFPDVPQPKLRRNLSAMLGVPEEQLDVVLQKHGPELKLHAAVDPRIRKAIASGPQPAAKGRGKALAAAPAPASGLSKSLRAQMAL
jgi:thermitase